MEWRSFEEKEKTPFVAIQEGFWEELQHRPECIAKKNEDKISYGWDSIINRVHTCGKEYERVARELARTNRFERRCLSKAFFEAHVKAHYEQKKNTFRSILKNRNSTYCFVFMDDPEPRTVRKALLASSCFVARGIIKENTTVLGIATEKTMKPTCTYDFCLMEIPTWGEQQQKEMDRLQKEIGIFSSYNQRHVSEDEYPSPFA